MKIALINASPKSSNSASGELLSCLKDTLGSQVSITEFNMRKTNIDELTVSQLDEHDVLVFAYPLYVDCIPSNLLSCLVQMEKVGFKQEKRVYTIVNCGFFEGVQNETAIKVLKNWVKKVGLIWGMGVGIGGGGAIASMKTIPYGNGPRKSIDNAINCLAEIIIQKKSHEDIYTSIGLPRIVYKLAAQSGWKMEIKQNGGKVKQLNTRIQ